MNRNLINISLESITCNSNTLPVSFQHSTRHNLLIFAEANALAICDFATKKIKLTLGPHEGRVNGLSLHESQDTLQIVAIDSSGAITVWLNEGTFLDERDWKQAFTAKIDSKSSINGISLLNLGNLTVFALFDTSGNIELWSIDNGDCTFCDSIKMTKTLQECIKLCPLNETHFLLITGGFLLTRLQQENISLYYFN